MLVSAKINDEVVEFYKKIYFTYCTFGNGYVSSTSNNNNEAKEVR